MVKMPHAFIYLKCPRWVSHHVISGIIVSFLLLGSAFCQSQFNFEDYLHCTHDVPIIQAFYKLKYSNERNLLDHLLVTKVKVIFKDLGTLNKSVKNYDALSWLSNQGQQLIFINNKHKNAPPEALAAIIAHESIHSDAYNSLQEEVAGWTIEATTWHEMKIRYPYLKTIPSGVYPLVDRLNQLEMNQERGTLDQLVRGNAGYRGLPETSPGFEGPILTSGQPPAN